MQKMQPEVLPQELHVPLWCVQRNWSYFYKDENAGADDVQKEEVKEVELVLIWNWGEVGVYFEGYYSYARAWDVF